VLGATAPASPWFHHWLLQWNAVPNLQPQPEQLLQPLYQTGCMN